MGRTRTPVDPLIEEFITYINAERGLSSNTQEAYRRDLTQLRAFVSDAHMSWPPDLDAIRAFIRVLQQNGRAPTSQVRALVAAKVFVHYLFRERYIANDISTLLEGPKLWQTLPSALSYQELERLLRTPDTSTPDGLRDRAILELLYGTGIRVSELCSLSIYDVSDDLVRVHGKGGKERLVPIGSEALAAVDAYLSKVRSQSDSSTIRHLFVTSNGKPLSRIEVWRMVRSTAKKAGIEKRVSPHTFRHTYATHLLDAGADVRVIQDLLGHAHISSTDRYTHVSRSQIRELFRAFHPRWKREQRT
jgi:integrase/recombinase XerD